MATSRGTSVSATSVQRRSATNRMSAIDATDQTPASRNALTMVAAASMTKTGVPAACGATPRTALTKRRKVGLSLPSPFGATSILALPSGVTQSLLSEGGRVSTVTRSALRRSLTWRSVVLSGVTRACSAASRAACGAFANALRRPARRRA